MSRSCVEGFVLQAHKLFMTPKLRDETRGSLRAALQQRANEIVDKIDPARLHATLNRDIFDLRHAQVFFDLTRKYDPNWTDAFLTRSVPFLDEAKDELMRQTRFQAFREDLNGKNTLTSLFAGGGAPLVVNQLLIGAGFTAEGVAAGTVAAGVHSTIGNVAVGSIFAGFQSIGATGLLATGPAVVTGAAVGAAGYGAWKLYSVPLGEDRVVWFLKVISEDQAKRDDFWSRISV